MILRRLALILMIGSALAVVRPVPVAAATWDFLLEDLSWPVDANPLGTTFDVSLHGNGETTQAAESAATGAFWGFLFDDLQWPDQSLTIDGGLGTTP